VIRQSRGALLALGCAAALILLIVVLLSRGSPREYLTDRYPEQSREGSSRVLRSQQSATQTAADLRKHWKPAQELVDPAGIFLRYSDLIVAVTPRAEGGSLVYLDDERRGYAHWYPYLGGSWGTGSPIGGTRGGGPGAGK
jgi:hypothetical protein